MKRLIIIVVGLILPIFASSQTKLDTLFYVNGDIIVAAISRITTDEVEYIYPNEVLINVVKTSELREVHLGSGRVLKYSDNTAALKHKNNHGLPADATLRELVAAGNNMYIILDDPSKAIDEGDSFLKGYVTELTKWNVVDELKTADFVLYVLTEPVKSFSKHHTMIPAIKRVDGSIVWQGSKVMEAPSVYNGFMAAKGVSKKVVEKSLLKEMLGSL